MSFCSIYKLQKVEMSILKCKTNQSILEQLLKQVASTQPELVFQRCLLLTEKDVEIPQ